MAVATMLQSLELEGVVIGLLWLVSQLLLRLNLFMLQRDEPLAELVWPLVEDATSEEAMPSCRMLAAGDGGIGKVEGFGRLGLDVDPAPLLA